MQLLLLLFFSSLCIISQSSSDNSDQEKIRAACLKAAENNLESYQVIKSCKTYPIEHASYYRLNISKMDNSSDVISFLAGRTVFNFSIYVGWNVEHFSFPSIVSNPIIINGDLTIINTNLNRIRLGNKVPRSPRGLRDVKLTINGNLRIRANRFLLKTELEKIKKDVNVTGRSDIQWPGECIIGSKAVKSRMKSKDTYGLQGCSGIRGDLNLTENSILPADLSPFYITGCVRISNWSQIVIDSNQVPVDKFFDQLNNTLYPNSCSTKGDIIMENMRVKVKHLEGFQYYFKSTNTPNVTTDYTPNYLKCDMVDIEKGQRNCTVVYNLTIGKDFKNDSLIYGLIDGAQLYGNLTIENYNGEYLNLTKIESISTEPEIEQKTSKEIKGAVFIKNNTNLKQIYFSNKFAILGADKCKKNIFTFQENPQYDLRLTQRMQMIKFATDGCAKESKNLYNISELYFPPIPYEPAEEMRSRSRPATQEEIDEQAEDDRQYLASILPYVEKFDFWKSYHPYYIFPGLGFFVVLTALSPICLVKALRAQRKLGKLQKEIGFYKKIGENIVISKNLAGSGVQLTEEQKKQVFALAQNLISIPVLSLRAAVVRGVSKKGRQVSNERIEEQETTEIRFRYELSKQIRDSTVMPVYDCPMKEDLCELQIRRRRYTRFDRAALKRPETYSSFRVYEIGIRFALYKNENKFREVFDIWANRPHDYYVILGVGDEELNSYCNHSFELFKVKTPYLRQSSHLFKTLASLGCKSQVYMCEYWSPKMQYDEARIFHVEFHRLPVGEDGDKEHPYSKSFDSSTQSHIMSFMLIAMQLDLPVFTNHPAVFFMLKMIHTAFFYIFKRSPAQKPEPIIMAAIEMALDEMDITGLSPPDVIQVFAKQMLDFCHQVLISEKFGPLYSYHFLKNKPSKNEFSDPTRKSLETYVESLKKLAATVWENVKRLDKMDLMELLPEEAEYCREVISPERVSFYRQTFESYAYELRPKWKLLQLKFGHRQRQYFRRRRKLIRLMEERIAAAKAGREINQRREQILVTDQEALAAHDEMTDPSTEDD